MHKDATFSFVNIVKDIDFYLGGLVSEIFPFFDEQPEQQQQSHLPNSQTNKRSGAYRASEISNHGFRS